MTDRIHFASAGAIRPKLLRAADSTLRIAFAELGVLLGDNPPPPIMGEVDAADLDELAEHMERVMKAVEKYADDVLTFAKHNTSGFKFDVNVTGILSDTRGDIVGTFKIAAEQMREFERECEDEF
jgi:hypothetical protein